jgi:hypothetical protein
VGVVVVEEGNGTVLILSMINSHRCDETTANKEADHRRSFWYATYHLANPVWEEAASLLFFPLRASFRFFLAIVVQLQV